MQYRILVTARDPAAALHLIEIVRYISQSDVFRVDLVTQQPATKYFQNAGIDTHALDLPAVRSASSTAGLELLDKARELIAKLKPNAILCGLSTPFDGGIDEAMTAVYNGPKFVMQDFWGEANQFFGAKADTYFALDDEAVRLSYYRHGLQAISVGSPRHSAYQKMHIKALRARQRKKIGANDDTTVVGFFGQALHNVKGYRRTLSAWVDAMINQQGDYKALYRPHPRESKDDVLWTVKRFKASSVSCVVCVEQDVEHSLLACDMVCSAFSNCTYDVAYLNYFSNEPLITPVSLFFDPGIVSYFHKMVKLEEFPYLKSGLVYPVNEVALLPQVLAVAGSPQEKHKYWEAAKKLPNPADAPMRVLRYIQKSLAGNYKT
ncbi:hypothetical protein [Thalassospira australica]|uniref:hypothetical protein n=1 Tax=Thalassospira australica TaxID=1528106 RepID=UPI000689BDD7|nr:hypothetical protein [Thalassospira australica]